MTTRCIMVVDDDPDDVELFIEAVRELDPMLFCQQARNGMEALTLLESNGIKPEIIFVDLNMPVFNGKEFIQAVRENKAYDAIQLFLYSTVDLSRNISELAGADGFFRKPISFGALCNKISEVIRICSDKTV